MRKLWERKNLPPYRASHPRKPRLGFYGLVATIGLLFSPAAMAAPTTDGNSAAAPSASQTGENLALASKGGTVEASGNELANKWQADKIIDGDKSGDSRWSSNYSDNAWVFVKLAHPINVHHVNIFWENACAARYKLQVSDDGQNWVDASESHSPVCGEKEVVALKAGITDTSYQYFKIQAEDRTPIGGRKYGVSLYELEVWNGPEPVDVSSQFHIVPVPVSLTASAGSWTLAPDTAIKASGDATAPATQLAEDIRRSTGYSLPVGNEGTIELRLDSNLVVEGVAETHLGEAYTLEVTEAGVTITARTPKGLYWGTRTLLQLFPPAIQSREVVRSNWQIPTVSVQDGPRYAHRGVQVDPARSFVTIEDMKQIIDTVALVKGSILHIHLADDQGWRIEITNEGREAGDTIDYTQLTERSGKTAMNDHEYAYKPIYGKPGELGHTGFYTQAEFRDLVAYAAARYVTIVPEIDLPGHTNAALYAIPQINSAGSYHDGTVNRATGETITDPSHYITAPANSTGNVGYSYLDPDSEWTKKFVRHVLKQVADLIPGQGAILHIGGDESHQMHRRYGQSKINEFLNFTTGVVRSLGKTPIGWNEISANTMRPGEAVQYWIGSTDNLVRAAREGAEVVLSNASAAYLDQQYPTNPYIGLVWAGKGDVDRYYNWNPESIIPSLPADKIRGVEGPQWSESLRGGYQHEFLLFPRTISHAEIGWSPQSNRSWDSYRLRLANLGDRLSYSGVNFYDGPLVPWAVSSSGKDVNARPGQEATLTIGQVAAPSTMLRNNGREIVKYSEQITNLRGQTQTRADSNTALGSNSLSATVAWGDGTQSTDAVVFTNENPRTKVSATGLYKIRATHTYANAGTYNGTINFSNGDVANFTATVSDNAPLSEDSTSNSVNPQITVEKTEVTAYDRVKVTLTGYRPNEYVEIKWNGDDTYLMRTDENGNASNYFPFTRNLRNGIHPLEGVQGSGENQLRAAVEVNLNGAYSPLENKLPLEAINCAATTASSEALNERAPNGRASALCDGRDDTFWHSKWSSPHDPLPHTLNFTLVEPKKITGFELTPRNNGDPYKAKQVVVYVSQTGNDGDWGDPVFSGQLDGTNEHKIVEFGNKAKTGKYVKFVIETSWHDGDSLVNAAEISFGGIAPESDNNTQPTEPTEPPAPTTPPVNPPANPPDPNPNIPGGSDTPTNPPAVPHPPATDPTAPPVISPSHPSVQPSSGSAVTERLAGSDRTATSLRLWEEIDASTMLIAGNDGQIDALSGGVLAALEHTGVVFTSPQNLDKRVADALTAKRIASVTILGGTKVVSAKVAEDIASLGISVTRISGADRYETDRLIAQKVTNSRGLQGKSVPVVIATGTDFADAITAAPVAHKLGGVVLLTDGEKLPDSTKEFLDQQANQIVTIGGPAVRAVDGHSIYGLVTALAGKDRYETAAITAKHFFARAKEMAIASGVSAADATAAGSYIASRGGGVLLTHPNWLPSSTKVLLGKYPKITIVGGEKAISSTVEQAVRNR